MPTVSNTVRRAGRRPFRLLRHLLGLRAVGRTDRGRHDDTEIVVWQWTKPKYRTRAIVLLLVNALLFTGVCAFVLWLRTGHYVMESAEQYEHALWSAFNPAGADQLTLIDYLVSPIPVDQVPLMLVIVGLLLGTLTAVPILVSMFYRFPFSLLFTLLIGLVALLPWLAITVTFCCFLARWRWLRFSFHYATALVAMLPLLVYYVMATRNATVFERLTPTEMVKLYVPWVLAVVVACVVMAVVLIIARLVNYRPGAISPMLALTFAVPVVLFEVKVGRDELYYRLLESNYGPGSKTHFADQLDLGTVIDEIVQERMEEETQGRAASASLLEQATVECHLRLFAVFAQQQEEAVAACDAFRRRYPHSRYVANSLFVKGRALDMRIDEDLLARRSVLRYHADFPSPASRQVWQEIHEHFPNTPVWSYATLRLAMLDARSGDIDRAVSLLDHMIAGHPESASDQAVSPAEKEWRAFLAKRPAGETLGINLAAVVQEACKLRYLLAHNRDPQLKDLPLRRLLSLVPRHPSYRRNLEQLRADLHRLYPFSSLADNLDVLIAVSEPSPPSRSLQIEGLRRCVEKLLPDPRSDALPHARYELGLAYKEDNRLQEAKTLFEEVVRLHPDSPWAGDAARRLAAMGAAAGSER